MERRLAAIFVADVVAYSRLMECDEEATAVRLRTYRKAIDELIGCHQGRVFGSAGDSVIAEFASPVEAVRCATEVQQELESRNRALAGDRRMRFRIGINLGDVMVEGDDLLGEGVNIAARLQEIAEPGGICVSQQVVDQVESKVEAAFEDLGERRVKNITRPLRVYGVRFHEGAGPRAAAAEEAMKLHQEIRFCTASDGTRIAYATVGKGPPLVKTANWMNHLEYDWESPIWRHLLHGLARDHRLVRYDARGNGLSDWDVGEIAFEAFVQDLETVVETAGLKRFALFGVSQGCAVSVAYAARHPERVSRLVLYGGFAQGRRKRGAEEVAQSEAFLTLMRQGWGQDNPAFRQIFTSLFLPEGTPEQVKWFNELQRMTTSPENAVRLRRAVDDIDVTDLLPKVRAPTLVLHCRGDAVQPFSEGRRMAALIPNARFVALEGKNHLILDFEPAWRRFVDEIESFLAD
jgi:class 3 adenylate cyclase/pimeloyl-ACP methyl ester carboxylesterase